MKTNCNNCQFSETIPGDCHLKCNAFNPLLEFNAHGVKNGWANYPENFDPIWIENECHQFRDKSDPEIKGLLNGIGFANPESFLRGRNLGRASAILANVDPLLATMYGFNTAMCLTNSVIEEVKEDREMNNETD